MKALYHYTTGAGLLGMLKDYSVENPNLTMWATHYMYMNDPTEFEYGRTICLDIIDEIEEDLQIEEESHIKKIVTGKQFQKCLLKARRHLKPEDIGLCPYLISLSQAEDSLHMWNMYATNGNGIAITFNSKELKKVYSLRECVYYTKKKHYENIKKKIREHYHRYANKFQIDNSPIFNACYVELMISLLEGIFIKHCSYKDEKEVRFVASQAKEILFRDKNGLIIPYVEQKVPFECVENIIVGPTADFNRVRESILLLMNSRGIMWDEDRIIKSNVPYRE